MFCRPAQINDYRAVMVENLVWAADRARKCAVSLLLEPLNPVDFPGYLVDSVPATQDHLGSGAENVGLSTISITLK